MSAIKKGKASQTPAVFLDRDGTIIEDRGNLCHPEEVVWYEDALPSLLRLSHCFHLFIVTNQSGVAKGAISREDADRVNTYVCASLARYGIPILATYVCPHERAFGCRCRKPSPHFLQKAERDYGVDLRRSFAIGDHPHDVELAWNAGATGIYVLSGHGRKHREEVPEDAIVTEGIGDAAREILVRARHAEGRQ